MINFRKLLTSIIKKISVRNVLIIGVTLCIGGITGCQKSNPSAQRLKIQRAKSLNVDNPYRNLQRADYYDSLRHATTNYAERYEYAFLNGIELLKAGESSQAAECLNELRKRLDTSQYWASERKLELEQLLLREEGLAYLRLGEQENCIHNHGMASCILPIKAGGIHHQSRGSTLASDCYAQLLKENPQHLGDRWLYSIAKMTLGDYSTTDSLLLPDTIFTDKGGAPQFQDIAPEVGLDIVGLSGGSVVEDFNRDGLLDVMISSWGPSDQIHLLIQTDKGTFKDKSNWAGLRGVYGGLNMVHADYDNDGWIDVLILRGAWMEQFGQIPNTLLRNLGNGKFEDVTWESSLHSEMPTQTAVWKDFNRDGWLDIYIGNETNDYMYPQPCELYINQKDGTFIEVAKKAQADIRQYVKGVCSADFDNNGFPDLFISTLMGSDQLLMNQGLSEEGIPIFENKTEVSGLFGDVSSFPTWAFDYNHDGWMDIFVSGLQIGHHRDALDDVVRDHLGLPNGADKARLWHNNGDGTFTDRAPELGLDRVMLAMGSNFGDFNNDGWLDIYLGTGEPRLDVVVPNRAFLNKEGKYFEEVSFSSGLGHIQKGHGVSFADMDADGDQDIHMVIGGAFEGDVYANALFENLYQGTNNWIKLRLEGSSNDNRYGLGAKIKLVLEGEEHRYFELNSGGSFGASPLMGHWGLGSAQKIDTLEIIWPSGHKQVLHDVQANQELKVSSIKK